MKKETVVLVVVAAAVIAFAAGRWSAKVSSSDQAAPAAVASAEAKTALPAGGLPALTPAKGPETALVTIVEVSDFQCPFCSRVGPTIKKLMEDYPKDVRVIWANQPLPFHDRAKPAATAAMAAHKQGKFWEMHDKLFANQRDLTDENFKKFAAEIGLDKVKFEADLKDPAIVAKIEADQQAANSVGARGTPAFFINGKLLSGAQPYEAFKKEVDEALAAAKKLSAEGKKGMDLIEAAAAGRDAAIGPKVVAYFIKGEKAPAEAAAPAREEAAADNGPAKPGADSYEIWKGTVDAKVDAIKGDSAKALVTIVEFSDFECPFCSRGANTVSEIEKAYGERVRVVFKHTPLPFHKNARPASSAAIAAGKQGKFWEYHDKAFANQKDLTEENLTVWAKELGLNVAKFDADRKSPAVAAQIEADMALGQSIGVRGTPGFLINGRKLMGAQPAPMFKAIIDEEIAKAEKAGKKGASYYDEVIANGKVFTELSDKVAEMNLDGLPYIGPKTAPVTIVEFSDFQCPFCSRVGEPVKGAAKLHAGKVKIVFAHFPLSFHQMARPASTAAQVAFEQGGPALFETVHDKLFASQKELSDEKIDQIAKEAGVDMAKLAAAKKDPKYGQLFDKTMEMGTKAGVEGTPTIFINGRKYEPAGGFSAESIASTIGKLLK
jgi:protein-disulfide isomerase